MADLQLQKIVASGLSPAFAAAAAGGDRIPFTRGAHLHVKAGATAVTVTAVAQKPCDQGTLHDLVVVVPANQEREIGPFGAKYRTDDGYVAFTYNQVATITVAAKELPS